MESRQNYWVQLLSLPPEDRRRFMLVLDLVAHRLTFRGVNRKISIEEDDSSFECVMVIVLSLSLTELSAHTPHYENVPFEIPSSWEWTTINDISKSILYGVSESAKTNGKYRLLRITDIQNNSVQWDSVPYTDFDENKAKPYLLSDGDILFARTGATVGKSYLVQGLTEEAIYASYLIRVQTYDAVLPQYLKFYFESGYYWEQIEQGSVGVGQPNVNGTILGNLHVPIPPIHEQFRIVSELSKWMGIIDIIENSQTDLQALIKQTKSKILAYIIHSGFISGYQNRYGDNLKPPTNVYHRMTA